MSSFKSWLGDFILFFVIKIVRFWVKTGGGDGDGLRGESGRDEQDAEGDRFITRLLRGEDFLIIFKPLRIYL